MDDTLTRWTTADEVSFIRHLYRNNPTAYANYSRIVLGRARRFDAEVDDAYVREFIRSLEERSLEKTSPST